MFELGITRSLRQYLPSTPFLKDTEITRSQQTCLLNKMDLTEIVLLISGLQRNTVRSTL